MRELERDRTSVDQIDQQPWFPWWSGDLSIIIMITTDQYASPVPSTTSTKILMFTCVVVVPTPKCRIRYFSTDSVVPLSRIISNHNRSAAADRHILTSSTRFNVSSTGITTGGGGGGGTRFGPYSGWERSWDLLKNAEKLGKGSMKPLCRFLPRNPWEGEWKR